MPIPEYEKQALTGNQLEVCRVIGALRSYKAACKKLFSKRHIDGRVDAVALNDFEREIEEIEKYQLLVGLEEDDA